MRRGDEARGRMTGKKVVVGDRKKTGMVRHWLEHGHRTTGKQRWAEHSVVCFTYGRA
jgi:hypothetical protein